MTTMTAKSMISPEEFLDMPDSEAVGFELVDGLLVKRNMGLESSAIAARIIMLLATFILDRRIGNVFGSDASFQCFPESKSKIRRADVSFVQANRLPEGDLPRGQSLIAPDLAVEVVSPRDVSEELDEKIVEWLRVGVRIIWVVSPRTRTIRIYRPRTSVAGPLSNLTYEDTLTGEDILPGFTCPVRRIFDI